jgi:hypothetical protein
MRTAAAFAVMLPCIFGISGSNAWGEGRTYERVLPVELLDIRDANGQAIVSCLRRHRPRAAAAST